MTEITNNHDRIATALERIAECLEESNNTAKRILAANMVQTKLIAASYKSLNTISQKTYEEVIEVLNQV